MKRIYVQPEYHQPPEFNAAGRCIDSEGYLIKTPRELVDEVRTIGGLTFQEYLEKGDVVEDAKSAGIIGEPYRHGISKKGRFVKIETRHKPLNNMDLYEFAKRKYIA